MGESLQNSFVDVVLLIGIDDNGVLQPAEVQQYQSGPFDLFATVYDVQVMGALSARSATFPLETLQDQTYPPGTSRASNDPYRSKSSPIVTAKANANDSRRELNDPDIIRSLSNETVSVSGSYRRGISRRRPTVKAVDLLSIRDNLRKNLKHPSPLPMASETLKSLATLCFPDGAMVREESQDASIHHLVLTDVAGFKTFASCLTYYTSACASQEDGGRWQLQRVCPCHLQFNHKRCYVPHCIVLISKFPYFSTLKECLSCILMRLSEDYDGYPQVLKEAALQLTMTPVAPPGPMSVEFQFFGINIRIMSPDHNRPLADFGLHLVFQCLTDSQILTVLTVLLMQKRIVFMSQDYTLLTIVCESFLQFIQPLRWELPYCPVLPQQCLDFLEAPGSYIFGIHVMYKDAINDVTELLVVDLDEGRLEAQALDIPSLPEDAVAAFRASRRLFRKATDLISLGRPAVFSYEEEKRQQEDIKLNTNRAVQNVFLELVVNLFGCTLPFITDNGQLKKAEFIQSCNANTRALYQQITDTSMFRKFARDRAEHRKDAWPVMEERRKLPRKPSRTQLLGEASLSTSKRNSVDVASMSRRLSSVELSALAGGVSLVKSGSVCTMSQLGGVTGPESPGIVRLPNFMYTLWQAFHSRSIDMLTTEIRKCEYPIKRASLYYLRGMFHAACSHITEAVDDFFRLDQQDQRIFPYDYVVDLLSQLPENVVEDIRERQRRSVFWDEVDRCLRNKKSSAGVDENILLMSDQDLDGFAKIVVHLGVECDRDAADRLFNVLSLGKTTLLTSATVEGFVRSWREVRLALAESTTHLHKMLAADEELVKVSTNVKTSLGQGRIALTSSRLIFIPEGSDKEKNIASLAELDTVERTRQKLFTGTVDAVRFIPKGDKSKPFVANLKQTSGLWLMMTLEMWSGRRMSDELYDDCLIHQAVLNALFIDAAVNSDIEYAASQIEIEQAAGMLCYYTRRYLEGQHHLSPVTKSYLHHFIDPNFRERERVSVESLLYIPGNVGATSSSRLSMSDDIGPELWCGMGNGSVCIFDAATWEKERSFQQAKLHVVCLVLVGGSRVWAGSMDCMIYIIGRLDRLCYQTLAEHHHIICDIICTEDDRFVFSASTDGKVIKWNASSLQMTGSFFVPNTNTLRQITLRDNLLWCCSREGVKVFSQTFAPVAQLLQVLCAPDGTAVEIDCFLLIVDKVWIGCRNSNSVRILDNETLEQTSEILVPGGSPEGISKMICVQDKVWIGTKCGHIFVCDAIKHEVEAVLDAHKASVRSMLAVNALYVMTGAGSADGKVALWRASGPLITDTL